MSFVRFLSPILFQGIHRKQTYFEGWYFKQTLGLPDGGSGVRTLAFIPGISRDRAGNEHAFVQSIDSRDGSTRYFSFPIDVFSWKDHPFEITIGPNRFSLQSVQVNLSDERGSIQGHLRYGHLTPVSYIMGPYTLVPWMECNHAIASMFHTVEGSIRIETSGGRTEALLFNPGKGYIEKDWGASMPSSWIWVHANMFERSMEPTSFFFSLARIPWMNRYFNGFISVLYTGGRQYRCASYTGGIIDMLESTPGLTRLLFSDPRYKLELTIRNPDLLGELAAPDLGAMNRRIGESNSAQIRIVLKSKHKQSDNPLFDGSAIGAGVELVGDIQSLSPEVLSKRVTF
ncbi:MAG: tocopherol cyclase family protein [Termitinemataceae bacterium]